MEKTITINIDGEKKIVPRKAYIKAKTEMLKEFGYSSLTEKEVEKGLQNALAGKANDVISMFIESDLHKD